MDAILAFPFELILDITQRLERADFVSFCRAHTRSRKFLPIYPALIAERTRHEIRRVDGGAAILHAAAAAMRGHGLATVELAVTLGADVNVRAVPTDPTTPLVRAVRRADVEMARFLLQHGARVHARDDLHETPLHIVAQAGDYDLQGGMAAGLEVGVPQPAWAERGRWMELARMLIAAGADVDALAPWQWAGLPEAVSVWPPLAAAIARHDTPMARLLLDAGADANGFTAYERGPNRKDDASLLHMAVRLKYNDLIELLLERGADVRKRMYGYTVMYTAVTNYVDDRRYHPTIVLHRKRAVFALHKAGADFWEPYRKMMTNLPSVEESACLGELYDMISEDLNAGA